MGLVLLKKNHDVRPVFLNLFKIHLPVTALTSILHRITGVVMMLALPILILLLYGVAYDASMLRVVSALPQWLLLVSEFGVVVAFMYHILAGLRHLFHDFTGSHSLGSTVISSWVVLSLWLVWCFFAIIRLMI